MRSTSRLATVQCPTCPNGGSLIRFGRFYRKSDKKWRKRWRCQICKRTISRASFEPEFQQKKRQINKTLRFLLCSGMSQRRLSLGLGVHRITIARKLKFLAIQARISQTQYRLGFLHSPLNRIQFDEMETHEHSKMKPLSIAIAVCESSRKILAFQVATMPARGVLAKKAVKKYGARSDDRPRALQRLFRQLAEVASDTAVLKSDQNPRYPPWFAGINWRHETIKGSRGAITGQGELKKVGFDPLFSLNHTAAMLRANISRLFRKTWNTTKKADALADHLWIYTDFHNKVLT